MFGCGLLVNLGGPRADYALFTAQKPCAIS
jgi:hypothetical protein